MTDRDALLAAYDALRPWVPAVPQPGLTYEQRGSVLRVAGQHRGFITTAMNVGVQGEALDSLIREQRDFFAQRGEAVEWKTRGHDEPPDLPARLMAAGFVPEERETVVIGVAEQMAVEPMLPDGVTLRQVHDPSDFARIAAMESEVWDDDFSWVTQDLQSRVQSARQQTHPAQARLPGDHDHHSLRLDTPHHGMTWPPGLIHSLVRNHALIDGNKRLALTTTIAFLGVNGRRLSLSNDQAYEQGVRAAR